MHKYYTTPHLPIPCPFRPTELMLPHENSVGVTRSSTLPASCVKAAVVDALGMLLAWQPRLAIFMGKLVFWLCPWLKGA